MIYSTSDENLSINPPISTLSLGNAPFSSAEKKLREENNQMRAQLAILWNTIQEFNLSEAAIQKGACKSLIESFLFSWPAETLQNSASACRKVFSPPPSLSGFGTLGGGISPTALNAPGRLISKTDEDLIISSRESIKSSRSLPSLKPKSLEVDSGLFQERSFSISGTSPKISTDNARSPEMHNALRLSASFGAGRDQESLFSTDALFSADSSLAGDHTCDLSVINNSSLSPQSFAVARAAAFQDPFANEAIAEDYYTSRSAYTITFLKCEWDFDDKGKDVSRYIFSIKPQNSEGWIIQKKLGDFLTLESSLKKELGKSNWEKCGKIGEKSLLSGTSPSSRELRKSGLEYYLNHLVQSSPDLLLVKKFISNDRLSESELSKNDNRSGNYIKEGYLIKKGSFFTPWIVRYYRLKNYRLDYYQTKYGPVHGSIKLPLMTVNPFLKDDDYRHSLVIEDKAHSFHLVLCAENDTERDEWVYHLRNSIEESKSASSSVISSCLSPQSEYPSSRLRSDAESIYCFNEEPQKLLESPKMPKSFFGKIYDSIRSVQDDNVSLFGDEEEQTDEEEAAAFVPEGLAPPLTGIFGIPIEDSIRNSKEPFCSLGIPSAVKRCVDYLEVQDAFLEEGIFRVSGSSSAIRSLREKFDSEFDCDLDKLQPDIHTVSGLLKLFFRELPCNILIQKSREGLDFYASCQNVPSSEEQVKLTRQIFDRLPASHKKVLEVLFGFLRTVTQHSNVNKMTAKNLGIVFSATLTIPTWLFFAMISSYDEVFLGRCGTATACDAA